METEEVSDRFVAPCFVNRLKAYDGEINLGVEENMISNEYAVKLCLEHKVKRGNKVVKKELIVALRGEIYFVKFIINPEEDDVKPGVIFEAKRNDDWGHLLDFNIDDILLLGKEGLSPFVCKIGRSSRNKKRAMENLNFFYQDIGTSSSAGGHLTQEEVAKEALAIKMSQKFALFEEEGFNVYFEGGLRSDEHFNAQHYWLSISREENLGLSRSHTSTIKKPILKDVERILSAPIYCRDLDTTTIRDLIDYDGWVGWRYTKREPTTHLVMLSRSITSIISSTHLHHHSISNSRVMMSSVETTRELIIVTIKPVPVSQAKNPPYPLEAFIIVIIEDPNNTTKEYIKIEEEKAHRCGKVYNWETATYGKIWYDDDLHDIRSVDTEFLDIVLNDALTSEVMLSSEPMVSPLNDNQIDFRKSFDESDDEDYTEQYDVSYGLEYGLLILVKLFV
uniref:Uncharacterized protein n=1 Tax=Tanacetum cinerariifolium TaxID=118510 RepID=A0A699GTH2_TANCI|nr:hypothetical protein [Tanacetum cinerariifolium]